MANIVKEVIVEVTYTGNNYCAYLPILPGCVSVEALLNHYSGIFTKAALARITGINERQLWHYASGLRKPRKAQADRITKGLHQLGRELLSVESY